jgi:hypothetical protein
MARLTPIVSPWTCSRGDNCASRRAMSPVGGQCCKSLFVSPIASFPGCRRSDRILMWGTNSFCDELTGDFGGAFEAASIDGCRLFCHFAEIWSHGVLGLLQTLSAPLRHADATGECRLSGVKRKQRGYRQNVAFDPNRTFVPAGERSTTSPRRCGQITCAQRVG